MTRLNGTWLQENIEGDVTDWLKCEEVGFANRQLIWTSSYGNGALMLHLYAADGVLYYMDDDKDDPDDLMQWRAQWKLDGSKTPFIQAYCAPIVPMKNLSVVANLSGDVLSCTLYKEDKMFGTMRREIGRDGNTMISTMKYTYPGGWTGDTECNLTFTHKRQPTALLTPQICSAWAPNVLLGAAAPGSKSSMPQHIWSMPLDSYWPTQGSLMETYGKAMNDKEPDAPGETTTVEGTETAFKVTTKKKESTETYDVKIDDKSDLISMKYTDSKEGPVGTFFFKLHEKPLRVECWDDISDEMIATGLGIHVLQDFLDEAIRYLKK